MPRFDQDFIQRVKRANPIETIIGETVDLKNRGREFKGRCPFCEGKESLSVSKPKQLFHCFKSHCNTHGTVFQWVQQTNNLSFREAVEALARRAGIAIPDSVGFSARSRTGGKSKHQVRKGVTAAQNASELPVGVTAAQNASELSVGVTAAQNASELSVGVTAAQNASELSVGVTAAQNASELSKGLPSGRPGEIVDANRAVNYSSNQSADRSSRSTERPEGLNLLNAFFNELSLSPGDEEKLWKQRRLASKVQRALGFRTNDPFNKNIIERVSVPYAYKAREESGLWHRKDGDRDLSIQSQFAGWGIKKRWKDEEGNDQSDWGYCNPILIPYFNEHHELIGLRPHKGNAKSTNLMRSRLYVPRDHTRAPRNESFYHVLITEGEFKAAAVWSVLGQGAFLWDNCPMDPKYAWGVCAIPGISMWSNDDVWWDIYRFITLSGCKEVSVIFDNELKPADRPPEKANDALKFAIGLAARLKRECNVQAKVGKIPDKYRDPSGKADFDGLLCQMFPEDESQSTTGKAA